MNSIEKVFQNIPKVNKIFQVFILSISQIVTMKITSCDISSINW